MPEDSTQPPNITLSVIGPLDFTIEVRAISEFFVFSNETEFPFREAIREYIYIHVECMLAAQYCVHMYYFYIMYRRTGFDCEYLLNANCEFFYDSQSFNTQS